MKRSKWLRWTTNRPPGLRGAFKLATALWPINRVTRWVGFHLQVVASVDSPPVIAVCWCVPLGRDFRRLYFGERWQ